MALIVEDGTGLANAQSYISTADADTYHSARGNSDWAAADIADKEAALVKASEYLDGKYGKRWIGIRYSSTQALDWPRDGAYDERGVSIDGVPSKLTAAAAVVALKVIQGEDINPDLERGGRIQTDKTGPLTTVYEAGASPVTVYTAVNRLLVALLKPAGLKVVR